MIAVVVRASAPRGRFTFSAPYQSGAMRRIGAFEHIGRVLRAIFGRHPFTDVRRDLRDGGGVGSAVRNPVQATPLNFTRHSWASGSPIPSGNRALNVCQDTRCDFADLFQALLSFAPALHEQLSTGAAHERGSIARARGYFSQGKTNG